MIRVLIAEDEAPARAKLQRWLGEEADVELLGAAADGIEAATLIERLAPDAVLLDIGMPGLSGLEVAAQLDPAHAPLLVFVTAFDAHALKAFELNAVDYLLKPYDRARLTRTLERLRERCGARGGQSSAVRTARELQNAGGGLARLLVPAGERLQLLDTATIHWIEADDNYLHLHTGTGRHMLRRTLADLLAQLDPARFVRIHRSAAVNLTEIASIEPLFKGDAELCLKSGQRLRLSRRYRDPLMQHLGRR